MEKRQAEYLKANMGKAFEGLFLMYRNLGENTPHIELRGRVEKALGILDEIKEAYYQIVEGDGSNNGVNADPEGRA